MDSLSNELVQCQPGWLWRAVSRAMSRAAVRHACRVALCARGERNLALERLGIFIFLMGRRRRQVIALAAAQFALTQRIRRVAERRRVSRSDSPGDFVTGGSPSFRPLVHPSSSLGCQPDSLSLSDSERKLR